MEIRRRQVAQPAESFTWNPQNFAGFYYDIKNDIGTETLSTTLTEGQEAERRLALWCQV